MFVGDDDDTSISRTALIVIVVLVTLIGILLTLLVIALVVIVRYRIQLSDVYKQGFVRPTYKVSLTKTEQTILKNYVML